MVAYCLGMVITFITVAFSAYRVSRMNIVAAIRDLPTPQETNTAGALQLLVRLVISGLFLLPFQVLYSSIRALISGRIVRGMALLVLAPLSVVVSPIVFVYTLFQLLLSPYRQGWMVVIRIALSTVVVAIGVLLAWLGTETDSALWARLGVTFAIVGLGLWIRSVMNINQFRPERSDRVLTHSLAWSC